MALTYTMGDVDVDSEVMRRNVIVHSLVAFFFNTARCGLALGNLYEGSPAPGGGLLFIGLS